MVSLRENVLVESRPGVNGGWHLSLPLNKIGLCVYCSLKLEDLLARAKK
jgi:DNA-binding IscR family transcriptional regulator